MRKDELQVCVSARQHGMMALITETAPAGNRGLTTTTIRESTMAEKQSTQNTAGAAA